MVWACKRPYVPLVVGERVVVAAAGSSACASASQGAARGTLGRGPNKPSPDKGSALAAVQGRRRRPPSSQIPCACPTDVDAQIIGVALCRRPACLPPRLLRPPLPLHPFCPPNPACNAYHERHVDIIAQPTHDHRRREHADQWPLPAPRRRAGPREYCGRGSLVGREGYVKKVGVLSVCDTFILPVYTLSYY